MRLSSWLWDSERTATGDWGLRDLRLLTWNLRLPGRGLPRGRHGGRLGAVMLDSCGACQLPLRDSPRTDEVGTHHRVMPCVAAHGHGRRQLVELPARCLVAARYTAQRHSVLIEMQQRIVAVQTAEDL